MPSCSVRFRRSLGCPKLIAILILSVLATSPSYAALRSRCRSACSAALRANCSEGRRVERKRCRGAIVRNCVQSARRCSKDDRRECTLAACGATTVSTTSTTLLDATSTTSTSRPGSTTTTSTFIPSTTTTLPAGPMLRILRSLTSDDPGLELLALAGQSGAISPDGRHVYLAGGSNDTLGQPTGGALMAFSRDSSSGELTLVQTLREPFPGRVYLSSPFVSLDGLRVYVTSGTIILVFSRDPVSGGLTPLTQAGGAGLFATDYVVSPDGRDVYASGSLSDINHLRWSGDDLQHASYYDLQFPGDTWGAGASLSPDGRWLYVFQGYALPFQILARNADTGTLAHVQSLPGYPALRVGQHLYVHDGNGSTGVYEQDPETGLANRQGSFRDDLIPGPNGPIYVGRLVPSYDESLIFTEYYLGLAILRRNVVSGVLSFASATEFGDQPRCIIPSPDGRHVYTCGGFVDRVFRILGYDE